MFREEKTASAKAPRWELAWCVRTPAVMLEQNEQGESRGGGQRELGPASTEPRRPLAGLWPLLCMR